MPKELYLSQSSEPSPTLLQMFISVLKYSQKLWSAWPALLVECGTLDLGDVGSSPTLGVEFTLKMKALGILGWLS